MVFRILFKGRADWIINCGHERKKGGKNYAWFFNLSTREIEVRERNKTEGFGVEVGG